MIEVSHEHICYVVRVDLGTIAVWVDIRSQGPDLRFGDAGDNRYSVQLTVNMPQLTDEGPAMLIFEKDLACLRQQEMLGLARGCHGERIWENVFVHNRDQDPPSKGSTSDPDEVFGNFAVKDATDQQIWDDPEVGLKADVMPDKIRRLLGAARELCLEWNPDKPPEGYVTDEIHNVFQEFVVLNIGCRKWSKVAKKTD